MGMFINVVSPVIKNKKMKVLNRNIFERIAYNFPSFWFCGMRIERRVANVKSIMGKKKYFWDHIKQLF
jgi:hypothetical protein